MVLSIQSAADFSFSTLCEVVNSAFVGYVGGEVQFTPRILASFVAQGDVHLGRSLVALEDDKPVGIGLLARRGDAVRVALMGVIAAAQGQGVGRRLLGQIEEEARQSGDRALTLEVIEQNPRAVFLYRSFGFTTMRRLMGYVGSDLTGDAAELVRVDTAEAARRITAWEPPDTPWQCTGETLITYGAPTTSYRLGDCYAVISNPEAETINIFGLATPPEQQRRGVATRMVMALIAAFPGKSWRVPAICPEEYSAIFSRCGLTPDKISQFQMERRLT